MTNSHIYGKQKDIPTLFMIKWQSFRYHEKMPISRLHSNLLGIFLTLSLTLSHHIFTNWHFHQSLKLGFNIYDGSQISWSLCPFPRAQGNHQWPLHFSEVLLWFIVVKCIEMEWPLARLDWKQEWNNKDSIQIKMPQTCELCFNDMWGHMSTFYWSTDGKINKINAKIFKTDKSKWSIHMTEHMIW